MKQTFNNPLKLNLSSVHWLVDPTKHSVSALSCKHGVKSLALIFTNFEYLKITFFSILESLGSENFSANLFWKVDIEKYMAALTWLQSHKNCQLIFITHHSFRM